MKKTVIIAEAGVNHNGDFELAKKLIRIAAEAGVDYVKFQTFKAGKLVSREAKKALYQIVNTIDTDDSQFSMLKKLEMPDSWHKDLKIFSESLGVKFLSTGFDEESIDFLDNLGVDFFKIPSGEITNKPYLQHIAKKGKPVILSTGMSEITEIKKAIEVIELAGLNRSNITALHCNTEYPTPMEDVNLRAMNSMGIELGVKVGYSDHTAGIEIPIAAVALGATVIEKHFTLDRSLPGPDHKASLEPNELISMVQCIRNIERAVSGSGIKHPTDSERKNIPLGRKSIHYTRDLAKGHTLAKSDLIMIRPGDGVSPMEIDKVIGRQLVIDTREFTKFKLTDITGYGD